MSELEPFETAPRSTSRRDLLVYLSQLGIVFAIAKLTPFWAIVAGPNGQLIPTSDPDEDNRVYHPMGFSVVAPNDWKTRISVDDGGVGFGNALHLLPKCGVPRRYGSGMSIHQHGTKPDKTADFKETTFQGEPALELQTKRGSGGFEDPVLYAYDLIFERDGLWYTASFNIFSDINELPKGIGLHLQSFKTHRHRQ